MKILNYALSGGDTTLIQAQAIDRDMVFQLWYNGVVATNILVEVWVSTDATQAYAKIPSATKVLVAADGTAIISLSGLAQLYVQFKVVAALSTAGIITNVNIMNGINII